MQAPPDTKFTPRSLRIDDIPTASAAYGVGVLLERIMRISNYASTNDVFRHYLDQLIIRTEAAWDSSSRAARFVCKAHIRAQAGCASRALRLSNTGALILP